jgi:hypothetical protein
MMIFPTEVEQDGAEQPSTNQTPVIYFPVGITVRTRVPLPLKTGLASLRNQIRAGSLF